MLKPIQYRLEYALIRLVEFFFHLVPRGLALRLGEGMGLLFSLVLASRTELALSNLKIAFPQKSDQEREKIVRLMWKNLGRTAVEFIRVGDIEAHNFEDYFVYEKRENLENARRLGKGVVLVAFHFTNWEMVARGTAYIVGGGTAIARPMKNPLVEAWVQKKRTGNGVNIILHRQAVKASLKALKEKQALGILVDQNLYIGGEFVDFFGRPAATTTLPALLHERTGAPVLIAYCLREGEKFRIVYEPMLEKVSTQIISKEIERVIRKTPENWFWIHNRWKRKQGT